MRQWQCIGSVPEDVDTRLLACQIDIGRDHIAYTAMTTRGVDRALNHRQLRQLGGRPK